MSFAVAGAPLASSRPQQSSQSSQPPNFATRVLPILTKSGCNAGACHGAAIGQGGFRLSLFGYDPHADYESIVREFEGRRVSLASPDDSLLLLKATMQCHHAGGPRFAKSSASYATIRAWLAGGARFGDANLRVVGLEVTPAEVLLPAVGKTQPLRVTARFSDGTAEEATALALYSSNDNGVAEVNGSGLVTMRARGVASIMIRYLGQVAAARVATPMTALPAAKCKLPMVNWVDEKVSAELERMRIPPSPLCDDNEFLRRIFIDVIGTLPTAEEVRTFQSSPLPAVQKRSAVVDALLRRAEFVDFWTLQIADLLLINGKRMGEAPARAYHAWLREQLAGNTPLDQLAKSLLLAQGETTQNGAANFWRVANDPRDQAEFVSRALFGVRVQCARCHNHPFDRWTQGDYHSFAALFARVRYDGNRIALAERGEVPHPKTGKDATPKVLSGRGEEWESGGNGNGDRRELLVSWLDGEGREWLARALANRVWKHLMGRGLIEPADDVRATNPPTNPALLQALTADLAKDFDLRRLARVIVSSRTYQLSSRANENNRGDERFFSRAYRKPLSAQVLGDAIAQATGVPNAYTGFPAGTRAIQLVDASTPSYTLDVFGRCRRDAPCDAATQLGGGLSQALHLINGSVVNGKLKGGIVDRLLHARANNHDTVEELYLRTLSRFPAPAERTHWERELANAHDRRETIEDLLWALLNSREFAFNH